jgi:hypothetical protein
MALRNEDRMKSFCFPLTLTLSRGEREQRFARAVFSACRLANPAIYFTNALEKLLPLLRERAGVRENNTAIS